MVSSTPDLSLQARLNERQRSDSRAVMYQRWEELLFLHWAVEPEQVQQELPDGLTVDTFDGVTGCLPMTGSGASSLAGRCTTRLIPYSGSSWPNIRSVFLR